VNPTPDTLVRAAPTEDITHCFIDLLVGWAWVFSKKRHSSHDLPRLAVATLGDFFRDPCALDGM